MTMLDERMRRIGEELDRAAVAYSARSSERVYVTPAPVRSRRQHLVVAIVAVLALFVGAALVVRKSDQDGGRSVADSPESLAIARNLGDAWLWPDADSDVPAGTSEEITREFASRVLGLSEFTVVPEAPDPVGMRIETPTMALSLLTARVPGPTDRWVVYELRPTGLSLSENGLALAVTSPPATASLDLFVRDASGGHAASLDNSLVAGNPIGAPLADALVSALVVFRDNRGEVIGAASLDADSITSQSLVSCSFELSGEQANASLHATLGDTASANIGVYTARVEVVEGRSAWGLSLLVSLSGPPGTSYEAKGDLSRTRSPGEPGVIGGGTNVGGGRLTFSCIAENPVAAPRVPGSR